MKINVNEFNVIESYEGTVEEMLDLIMSGIFDCDCDEYEDEDCGCEDEEVIIVSDEVEDDIVEEPHDMGTATTFTEPNEFEEVSVTCDLDKHKNEVREELRKKGIELSDDEFENYYELAINFVNLFDGLLNS